MKYISICSGIEAATVAFHPLGWTPLAFSEIEPFPCSVLAHHYPAVPNLGDMTKYHDWPEELLAECDLLVGGPPCQAFSMAGQRRSLDDERGNLTLTYVNLINHIDNIRRKHGRDPVIALYENVPGIYSTKDNAFGCLVGAICGQDAAVETETGKWPTTGIFWGEKRRVGYRTLDAQYFGLAQRRRRCFLLAVPNELVERLGDRACPSEILSIPESLRGDSPPRRGEGESVAGTFKSCTGSGGWSNSIDHAAAGYMVPSAPFTHAGGCWWDGEQVGQTLDAALSKGQAMPEKIRFPAVLQPVTHSLRADGFDASEDGTGRGTPLVPVAFTCKDYGADAGDISPTLRAMGHSSSHANAGGQVAVAIPLQEVGKRTGVSTNDPRAGIGIGADGDPMFTLQSGAQHGVAFAQNTRDELRYIDGDGQVVVALAAQPGMKQQSYLQQGMAVRRITVTEAERLMGVPDGYTMVPYRGKPASECADGPRYRSLGNSFAVPCIRWLGRRIELALGLAA